jgi:phage-related protein
MSGTELIEAFGGHVEPILKLVTDLFLIHNFGPFIAGVLITIGFVILVTLVVRVGLAVLGTGRARGYLLAIASGQEFAQRFSAIDQHLRTNAAVSSSWRALAAGFSFPEPTRSGDGLIRSPVRPQQAFHPDEANLNLTYFRLWPNLFVGVGLLLTFAGLISALTVAVGGFAKEAATSKELQGSLGVLLTVSAAKFYSSLAALAVSLALTISIRLGQSVINRSLLGVAEAIEDKIRPVTPESLLADQIQELQEQTSQLKTFNTDLAIKIGDSVERAVGSAMHGVTEKLDRFASNLGQDNVAAIKDIGESVSRSLHGAAGDALGRLSERLDSVGTALSGLVQALERSGQSFQSDMTATMEGLRSQLSAMASSLTGISDGLRSSLQEGAAGITASLEQAIRGLTAATERSAAHMEGAVQRLADGVRSAVDAAADGAATAVTDAGTSASRQLIESVTRVADNFVSGFEPIHGVAASLAGTMSAANAATDRLTAGMEKASQSAAAATAKLQEASQQVGAASQSLRQTLEPVLVAAQRIQESSSAVREASQTTMQAVAGIANDLRETRALWEKHSARFDDVDRALGLAFQEISKGLADNLQRLHAFVVATDGQFSQAITSLSDAIDEFRTMRPTAPVN